MNAGLAVPTIDNFKEVMNTTAIPTYTPGAVGIADNNTSKNASKETTFARELAEKTNQFENTHKHADKETISQAVETTNKHTGPTNESGNTETRKSNVDKPVEEKPNREQLTRQGGEEKAARQTGSEKSQLAANIKKIIQEHQLQSIELVKIKENTRENFGVVKKINTGQDMERIMLKNLAETEGKSKNSKVNAEPIKDADRQDAKLSPEKNNDTGAVEKKDNVSSLKNETVVERKTSSTDSGVVSMTNLNTGEGQLTVQAKLQALLPRYNIQEQYEALKEKIVNSVENSIKFMIAEGENRVGIKLYPPELGKIQIELVIKDNQVNARINTENTAVKETIMSNLEQLKSSIENAGIVVNKFDVEVGGFRNQFDRRLANGRPGNRRIESNEILGSLDLPEEEWLADKIIKQKAYSYFLGRSINYLV